MARLPKKRRQALLRALKKEYETGRITGLEWSVRARQILRPGSVRLLPKGQRVLVKLPSGLMKFSLLCKSCGWQHVSVNDVARAKNTHRSKCRNADFVVQPPGSLYPRKSIFSATYYKGLRKGRKTPKRRSGLNCPEVYPDDN